MTGSGSIGIRAEDKRRVPLMRRLLVAVLMLGVSGSAMAAITDSTPDAVKDPGTPYINPDPPIRVTGDTIGDPFILVGLGTVSGTTAGFTNDYEEACPYSSTSPDVVYAFTPDADISVNIDLCYSSYDTKVYVYDSNPPHVGYAIACNDDYWSTPPCYPYSSFLAFVGLVSGHTYYIVIDGYGGQSGSYSMDVTDAGTPPSTGACCAASGTCTITFQYLCEGSWQGEDTDCTPNPCPQPPSLVCPPGALIEGEPPCVDGYIDQYNSGCGGSPPVWSPINPQATGCAVMCGKSCTFGEPGLSRDTDWFESFGAGALVTATCTAEFPLQFLLIYGTDCALPSYLYGHGDPGVPVTLTWTIGVGEVVWFWVGNQSFWGWPESDYVLDVCGIKDPPLPPGACCRTGLCVVMDPELCIFVGGTFTAPGMLCDPDPCQPVATESKSWGAVKNLYR
jgi:hypothetical protein